MNGQPGLAQFDGETLITIMAFEMVDNRLRRIYFIRNPDKLARIQLQ